MQAKFFCQNSGETNEWAAKLLGERWVNITSTNAGNSSSYQGDRGSSGVSRSEQRRYYVEPSRFTTLKRGGPLHRYQVQAVVYNGGHAFQSTTDNELLPCKLLTFNQK